MPYPHLPRRLTIGAIVVMTSGVGAVPALAAAGPRVMPTGPTPTQLKKIDSTPLGRAIDQQGKSIRLNLQTGTPRLDREAIPKLTSNSKTCEKAASAVAAVPAQPGGRQPEIKREWVKGAHVLALADQQLAAYFRAEGKGDGSAAKLHTALSNSNYGDGLTGWAFNGLTGNPGPLPKRPPIS